MTATASPRGGAGQDDEPAGGEMTLVEHLRELRTRIMRSALALGVGFVIGFVLREHVLDVIRQPYCDLPSAVRDAPEQLSGDECGLVVLQVLDGLMISIKLAAIVAVIVAAPVVSYQVLRFVMPGLRSVEKRYAIPFLLAGWVLFLTGAVFAYYVIPLGLELLLSLVGEGIVPLLSAREYVDFMLFTIVAFGVSFELPLILTALILMDVVGHEGLRRFRRHAIFGAFVAAAIITPTGDAFTMSAMAVPLIAFYEGCILFARLRDRRRRRLESRAGRG